MENSNQYDHIFKYSFVGDSGVGKTSMIHVYFGNKFNEYYDCTVCF